MHAGRDRPVRRRGAVPVLQRGPLNPRQGPNPDPAASRSGVRRPGLGCHRPPAGGRRRGHPGRRRHQSPPGRSNMVGDRSPTRRVTSRRTATLRILHVCLKTPTPNDEATTWNPAHPTSNDLTSKPMGCLIRGRGQRLEVGVSHHMGVAGDIASRLRGTHPLAVRRADRRGGSNGRSGGQNRERGYGSARCDQHTSTCPPSDNSFLAIPPWASCQTRCSWRR